MIRPAYLWMLVLFMMLISKDNTNLFKYYLLEKNLLLCYIGKYSFGIYLFHPMCLMYVRAYLGPFKTQFDFIFYSVIASYFVGFLFFYLVENISMKFGNYLCSKLYLIEYFIPKFIEKIKERF